jgi:hypothetical protein
MNRQIIQQIKQQGTLVSTPNDDGTSTDVYTLTDPSGDTVVYTHISTVKEIQAQQDADQAIIDQAQATIDATTEKMAARTEQLQKVSIQTNIEK